MISSTVNNHLQPKGRPALYFSTTMGLESFLPMLWEKDGLSCSFLKSASLTRRFALHVPLFPGHRRCTSSLQVLSTLHYSRRLYPVFWHFPVINAFLTKFSSKAFPICLAWHREEEKCIIKQSDTTSFALLAINEAFRQASEAQVQAVSGCSYLRSATIPPTMQHLRYLRANRKWHLQIGTSSFCTLLGC